MIKKILIPQIVLSAIILAIGLSSGYAMGYFSASKAGFPVIQQVTDMNPGISTIKFLKLENGLLKGEVVGKRARLAHSPESIRDVHPGESFEIPIYSVNLGQYYTARDLPEGMQYIASRQGKYYYSVLDPKAFRITPKNRVYFSQKTEAEKMGYLPSN